ncbi:MAG: chemotaxis protein CheB, partial [Desulfonatronovibrio sp.]
ANVLFSSLAQGAGKRALCVLLTGMGNDGLLGARDLKAKGARILAQSEDTCVVYGMPKSVVDDGLADQVVDLEDMARMITTCLYQN